MSTAVATPTTTRRRTLMPPARWLMVWLCFAALAVNYTDRANLAVAAPSIKAALHVDNTTMGLLLGSFFWTYALMQLPAGWLVDRFGARLMFPVAVCWWSLFTALTAFANSAATLFGFRLLLGAGEAGGYPSSARVVSRWFPPHERGLASSIFDSGSRAGNLVAIPLCAWLIGSFGWRASFVITGLLGFVWAAAWLVIYRKPEQHPDVHARSPPRNGQQPRRPAHRRTRHAMDRPVPLSNHLGHDDRLLLSQLRHLLLHHLVPDLSDVG